MESERAGEESMQSLGETVVEDGDNEHMNTVVESSAVAESAEGSSTPPKSRGTETGTGEEEVEMEAPQQLSAPRRRLRDRLRLRMGRYA